MLNKNDLQQLSVTQLQAIEFSLSSYLFKEHEHGEPMHPQYRRNKKSFNLLIKQMVTMDRIVRDYRKQLLDNLQTFVQLHKIKADEAEDYFNDPAWMEQNLLFANKLADGVYPLFDNGADTTMQEKGIGTSVGSDNAPQAKFLSKYVVDLAGNLNKTTKQDITEAIRTSLTLGENRDELTARINDILDDPYRSEMIAQTESIRAFSQGRLAVGIDAGYTGKIWRWPGNSDCPICPMLAAQGPIPINDEWDTGSASLGTVPTPPAHPWCQCGHDLVMLDVSGREKLYSIKGGWITKDGNHIYIDDGGGENPATHFGQTAKPTAGQFSLHDAEHMIKYNAALQAERDVNDPAIKELIYKADVKNATSPMDMAGIIFHSLPANYQSNADVRGTLTKWGRQGQNFYNYFQKNTDTSFKTATI